jgi:hypothetical protein
MRERGDAPRHRARSRLVCSRPYTIARSRSSSGSRSSAFAAPAGSPGAQNVCAASNASRASGDALSAAAARCARLAWTARRHGSLTSSACQNVAWQRRAIRSRSAAPRVRGRGGYTAPNRSPCAFRSRRWPRASRPLGAPAPRASSGRSDKLDSREDSRRDELMGATDSKSVVRLCRTSALNCRRA